MSATTLHEFSIHKPSSFSSAYRHLLSPVYRSTSCSLIVLDVVQLAYNSAYGIRIEDMPLCTRYESTYESLRDPYWCTLSRTIAIVTFPCPAQHQQSQQLPLPRSTFETNFPNEKIPTNFISSSQLFKTLSDYTRNTDHTEGIEKKKKIGLFTITLSKCHFDTSDIIHPLRRARIFNCDQTRHVTSKSDHDARR